MSFHFLISSHLETKKLFPDIIFKDKGIPSNYNIYLTTYFTRVAFLLSSLSNMSF